MLCLDVILIRYLPRLISENDAFIYFKLDTKGRKQEINFST